jgi:hypothetical protein
MAKDIILWVIILCLAGTVMLLTKGINDARKALRQRQEQLEQLKKDKN